MEAVRKNTKENKTDRPYINWGKRAGCSVEPGDTCRLPTQR